MKDDKGVFAVARSIWNNPDFDDEPFTQREAWMWLIGAAAWRKTKIRGQRGIGITLNRGEFLFSLRFLVEKWTWSKSRVERFLKTLEKRDMIRDVSRDGSQVYFICNYAEFQVVGLPSGTQTGTETETKAGRERDKEETLETLEDIIITPAPPLFPTWLDLEVWAAFEEMRKKIRKPLTPYASKLLIAKLDRWRQLGHDPTSILNYSIEGSYQGLFEPKGSGNGRARDTKKRSSTDKHLDAIAEIIAERREIAGTNYG